MTTAQVKKILVKKINDIEHKSVLDEINMFIDRKSKSFYKTNDIQRKRINKSKKEFEKNLGVPHEKVMSEHLNI